MVVDPQGRIEHAASVLDDGETTWLIVDRADAEALLSWLRKMRFRLRVEHEKLGPVSDQVKDQIRSILLRENYFALVKSLRGAAKVDIADAELKKAVEQVDGAQ